MSELEEKLILIGAGGHCKVVIDIIKDKFNIYGVTDTDKAKHGTQFYGINVLGDDEILRYIYSKGINKALVTLGSVGNSSAREKLFNFARMTGFEMINAISTNAVVSKSLKMGAGNVVMDGAIIHADTSIGDNNIINTGCIIEHDCIIGNHTHISVGAKLAGGVKIGNGSHVGMGATLIQGISVGVNCIIGAGAVVIRNVPDNTTVVGVPAKTVRQL